MRVVLLGTGGFHPNEMRHTACIMLPEIGLVFDAGSSFFRVADRVQKSDLSLFLTHAHLDHICGLTYAIVPLLDGRISSLKVHGTAKTISAVRTHLFAKDVFPVELPNTEYCELADEVVVDGGGTLRFVNLEHPGGSVGYRIDWPDRSMAYITDTTAPGTYEDFIRGVDLLIHECYFPDDVAAFAAETGHSNTTPVVQVAKAAGVGELVLVHIDPQRTDDDPIGIVTAQKIFPKTTLAKDLMELDF